MSDLTTEDRALLVRIARENADKAIRDAINAVLTYADMVQLHGHNEVAERQILQAYVTLGQAKMELNEVAE
jgi:hypothetical protein